MTLAGGLQRRLCVTDCLFQSFDSSMLRAREVMKKKAVSKIARGKLAKVVVFSGRKETLAS